MRWTGVLKRTVATVMACMGVSAGVANAQLVPGGDIVHSNIQDTVSYGVVGGVGGYSIGSWTCNIGDTSMNWNNGGTPGLAMNAYRLYNGSLTQIGMSWVKLACCVANSGGCVSMAGQSLTCGGGFGLRPGCRDVYSASWNGGQSRLAQRSSVNAFTRTFGAFNGSSGDAIFKRLQVNTADFSPTTFPGATYLAEGVYVASDENPNNVWNNASYRPVVFSGTSMSVTGATRQGFPAMQAWADAVPGVVLQQATVPGEGRYWFGARAVSVGGGWTRYEYNVFNLNSHVSGGSLSIPLPPGAAVRNVGFSAPDYHSGEVYSNADWTGSVGRCSITFQSPQTFAQNPNTNALRWGTMYSFWFEAQAEPATGSVNLGLFRPFTPQSVAASGLPVPSTRQCRADWNGDGVTDFNDLLEYLNDYNALSPCAELNGDGVVDFNDLLEYLNAYNVPCP
jgi:hypothetical protein